MLEASDRASFAELLRPPPGHALVAGLGTAFSLQFPVLVAMLLALAGAEVELGQNVDPAIAVTTLRRLRGRFRVFVNRTSISADLGRLPGRLVTLLGGVLRDVAVENASFHPKVWILQFEPTRLLDATPARRLYRLVCASRNLADSRCWELAAVIEGLEEPRENALGHSIAVFVDRLLRKEAELPSALSGLVAGVAHADFQPGRPGRDHLEFLWQAPGRGALLDRLPARGRRALLLAPFVGARFLRELVKRFDEVWLASRTEELAALGPLLEAPALKGRVFAVETRDIEELGALDLHAKLLLCESSAGPQSFVGSANGTASGWGMIPNRNLESLLALTPGVDIDHFRRAFLVDKTGAPYPWVVPFRLDGAAPVTPDPEAAALDRGCQVIASFAFEAAYEHVSARLTLKLPSEALKNLPGDIEAEIAPLLLQTRAGAFRPLRALVGGAVWEPVTLADLCDFAAVRLRTRPDSIGDSATPVERTFVVRIPIQLQEAVREARDDAACADLLREVDPLAVLWTVLWGVTGIAPSPEKRAGRPRRGHGARRASLLTELTLERLLEACTQSPDRIEEVDGLLRALRDRMDLDREFMAAWQAFKAAHAAVTAEDDDPGSRRH